MDKVLSPGDTAIVCQRMNTNRQNMEKTFEQRLHDDLHRYLLGMKVVDERLPECPDVEGRWKQLIEAYLPDGIREFAAYPTVSLGWMMFIGMAVAYMWDKDWMRYNADPQLYELLRDARGYDAMDDHIMEDVLRLDENGRRKTQDIVAECASRTDNMLRHEHIQPGTKEAFQAYTQCLHQLYLMGMAMQLSAMGYHMTPLNLAN